MGEHQASRSIPLATPGINQHSPLGRLTSQQNKQTKTWTINKLAHNRGGRNAEITPKKGEGEKSWSSCELLVNKWLEMQEGEQQAGDKPLSEVGQVADHKAHLSSHWATTKVKWSCKIEEQSANHHNMLTAGGWLIDHWPCPRESGQGKETSSQ
jgi:hypothetical protein